MPANVIDVSPPLLRLVHKIQNASLHVPFVPAVFFLVLVIC
ncbi:hypothetical protein [Sporisorium scitamineum]|uniref:Uncharacterized protein n=1 Tax=Sporisorium scitamineum TaxID=49012 RepID=A0A0F7S1Z7_9BASI|nr:hypothetical protein [Sporisorium scitamineum]